MSITIQTDPNGAVAPAAISSFAMRMLVLGYGGLAYLIFLGTFLYAIGFVSRLVVPKTIDTGPESSSLPAALLINLALMSIFAVQHSGMARQGFKRLFARFAAPAIERSTYVLLREPQPDLTVLAMATDADGGLEYRRSGLRRKPRSRVAFAGWLIVLYSTFLISHFELFGLTQVVTHFAGRVDSAD